MGAALVLTQLGIVAHYASCSILARSDRPTGSKGFLDYLNFKKMADKDEQQEKTIAEDLVVTKYKMAGDISNRVIQAVIKKCVSGASVRELCSFGDSLLLEETNKVFKKEKDLKKGDMVKIDLGAQVDGFIAAVAHTVLVGGGDKITGRKADLLLAAHHASEVALRLMKPGTENVAVTSAVQKVAESYQCKPVEGMLSHQLKQFEIDGDKSIIQNPNEMQKKEHEKSTFELHEVYAIDVLISTGEGVGREMETRTTVFKKSNETYMLKMKTSRALFSEVSTKCGSMPFCLRSLEDEKKARMGVVECVSHKLLEPFHVLYEKPSEMVAQFKFTVLLMPNGPQKITGITFDPSTCQSEHSITDEDIKKLLTTSTKKKPNKKKKATTAKDEKMEVAESAE